MVHKGKMVNTMQEHSTNAMPVEFGWDFQYSKGILIVLMNITSWFFRVEA